MKKTTLLAITLLSSWAIADVTPSLGTESSTDSGLNTPIRSLARTYQEYFAPGALSAVASPTQIIGVQFRLAIGENWRPAGYVGTSWPDAALNFTDWTMKLGTATSQLVTDGEYLSTTPTFASYFATSTVVKTGALTIAANSMPADGGATGIHSWATAIMFDTPYTINPGDSLVMQINHSGYGATGTPLNAFFASRSFQNGLCDAISSTASGSAAAPNGFSSPVFVNFITAPVPEPATLTALGIGLAAILKRRRK